MEEELYKKYSERLRFKFLRDLRGAEVAEDLVQETFAIYLKALKEEKIKNPESSPSFLIGIANNLVMKSRNSMKKVVEKPYDDSTKIFEPIGTNPELQFLRQEDEKIITNLLDKLEHGEKQLIKWHYIEGKNLEEISQQKKISKSALKMRLHRIRKKLKKMIKP